MRFAAVLALTLVSTAARGEGLAALQERIATDAKVGRPIVVQVHVGLCERRILRCGGGGLGDGDDVDRNLYWGTSGGLRGWVGRKGSGWTQVARDAGDGHTIERIVWKRRVSPDGALRALGVTGPFDVYLVAHGWRGVDNDLAIAAYAEDLVGGRPRPAPAVPGVTLPTGGQAHLVAYVGHNRWMDRPDFRWPAIDPAAPRKGTIAVACYSAAYLGAMIERAGHVALLMTKDFCFAGSHAMEGAAMAFLSGKPLAQVRDAGAQSYATGEGKSYQRVRGAFLNAADPGWGRAIAP